MDIYFESNSFRKECENRSKLRRKQGRERAALIEQRLYELRAATCLDDLRDLPGPRLHQHTRLKGQEKAVFSVDLDHPKRLLFLVAHDPEPALPGGGVDWKQVTAITIIDVRDPHE